MVQDIKEYVNKWDELIDSARPSTACSDSDSHRTTVSSFTTFTCSVPENIGEQVTEGIENLQEIYGDVAQRLEGCSYVCDDIQKTMKLNMRRLDAIKMMGTAADWSKVN